MNSSSMLNVWVVVAPCARRPEHSRRRVPAQRIWRRDCTCIIHCQCKSSPLTKNIQTALVLPGSANAIGGQGAVIKLRHTEERSPTSMLLENPWETNTTVYDPKTYFRFRQMKYVSMPIC